MGERKLSSDPTMESQQQIVKASELASLMNAFLEGVRKQNIKKPMEVAKLPRKYTSLRLEDIGNELLRRLVSLPDASDIRQTRESEELTLLNALILFREAMLISPSEIEQEKDKAYEVAEDEILEAIPT